ncbi:unnamed protein product, partial [Linum tenue]
CLVTLATSVLTSMPTYAMQTTYLPISICDAIDRRVRSFIWGSTADKRKIHLVHWEGICRPKHEGGLGLRQAHELNLAFLAKLAWGFIKNPDELWVQVLQAKYFRNARGTMVAKSMARASSLWRGMRKAWPIMTSRMGMTVKDGRSTSFWTDRWVGGDMTLLDHSLLDGPLPDLTTPVANFVNDQASNRGCRRGRPTWFPEEDGRFRVRSAYAIATSYDESTQQTDWRTIWQWEGPARAKHFLWLTIRDRLLTNAECERRHLTTITTCPRCKQSTETVLHVLRDCPFSRLVWMQLIPLSDHQRFFGSSQQVWILDNLRHQHFSLEFGITCWALWRSRNDLVFAGKIVPPEAFIQRVRAWLPVVRKALDQDRLIHRPSPPARTEELIHWQPPPPEWVCLNSDGSGFPSSGHAAAGGLIRDHLGRCLTAFAINLGTCSITQAELRGVVEGLQVAWDAGHRRVLVQLDFQCAVQLLQGETSDDHPYAACISRFRELCSRSWSVKVSHIYREGNVCADYLASRGLSLPFGCHLIPTSDPLLSYWTLYDCQGVSIPRWF